MLTTGDAFGKSSSAEFYRSRLHERDPGPPLQPNGSSQVVVWNHIRGFPTYGTPTFILYQIENQFASYRHFSGSTESMQIRRTVNDNDTLNPSAAVTEIISQTSLFNPNLQVVGADTVTIVSPTEVRTTGTRSFGPGLGFTTYTQRFELSGRTVDLRDLATLFFDVAEAGHPRPVNPVSGQGIRRVMKVSNTGGIVDDTTNPPPFATPATCSIELTRIGSLAEIKLVRSRIVYLFNSGGVSTLAAIEVMPPFVEPFNLPKAILPFSLVSVYNLVDLQPLDMTRSGMFEPNFWTDVQTRYRERRLIPPHQGGAVIDPHIP